MNRRSVARATATPTAATPISPRTPARRGPGQLDFSEL